ncbi:MAG: class I SAM-dependent methyltransferase, partial [Pirellulales bacterium]
MNNIALQVIEQYGFSAGDSAVEIGSADGYQLGCFAKHGFNVFGYEPSSRLAETSNQNGIQTTQSLFDQETLSLIPDEMDKVQVFMSFYTFDHIPDPFACLKSIREKIDPERGIAVIEIHDLEEIVKRREACLFCHEHTIYLSQLSLERMLKRAGMKLLSVDLLPEDQCRGNSLLAVCAADTSVHESKIPAPTPEQQMYDQWSTFEQFGKQVEIAHQNLHDYVKSKISAGKTIAGYGASARSISTLSLAGIDSQDISYLCDGNPHLQGKYLPYSGVQVVGPEQLKTNPVDEVIVFAYGYFNEIVSENSSHTLHGGEFTSLLDLLKNNNPS